MKMDRRTWMKFSGAAVAGTAAGGAVGATVAACAAPAAQYGGSSSSGDADVPDSIRALEPMLDGIEPITDEERLGRMEHARQLMTDSGIDAIFVESGSSMFYFTGMRWGNSERMFGLVLPAEGDIAWVCPQFEEERARELIRFGDDVRGWEEHESPAETVAGILSDRGIRAGTIGMEERVRFFLYDNIRQAAPSHQYVSADPITVGCRAIKSAAEIALMQRAMDITIEAYRAAIPLLHEGMSKGEFSALTRAAHTALGVSGGIGCNFGEASAFPHGSIKPVPLREGDIVLMDGGCGVEGYRSDISRTTVLGQPSQRQIDIWDLELEAQTAAFEAAQVGVPCEEVDAAARKVIVDAGFGPDYQIPGLPHRTGHGIGLDGHEWINFVRGNKTPLAPGMCFSNEPMIAIYGEFGVRLEDCMYITDDGPQFFTKQSRSITEPLG